MLEFKYDTQLLIEGNDLEYCSTLGEIYDIVIEDMDRQARGLQGYIWITGWYNDKNEY